MDSIQDLEDEFEKRIDEIGKGTMKPLYGHNIHFKETSNLLLKNVPLNIKPEYNPELEKSVGINEPTFYLAGESSFTEVISFMLFFIRLEI